ncbi:uncharacterized protein LOC104905999 isoform X3 [Beta vulgaris subsp. vulgaris]|uniref:uncharacterized protein LOC104905999 isoform X3 n=1 Tax=Beta vulgaris subsp. vulgaris TaxID=3555 RepID=UPI002036D50B|nr:uncharacterized protein LOC104905999 isoform X3 [Beta vulgaris subsp. vulgaris]
MRYATAILRHHRHATLRSTEWSRTWRCLSFQGYSGPKVYEDHWFLSIMLQKRLLSTSFKSVHGERPTAEYAKQRKESLEEEFGHVLGTYSSRSVSVVYRFGPFLALFRAAVISYHVLKLSLWQLFVDDIHKRATKFCDTLIRLGPFYIKLGQALSTRPDILPTIYCQELSKLQDQIPPFPTSVAMRSIESQLGVPVSELFTDISPEPVAAASLGQVYKAHLHSGELVAVKVQRPGMSLSLTLDALLFHMIGGQLKRFAKARKDLLVAVNEMVRHMFEEIDYILEGENAERFASLYASYPGADSHGKSFEATLGNSQINRGRGLIRVPKIYWKYTRKAVLTMEWINGIKLTNEDAIAKLQLKRMELVDQGLYCSLRQLLEVGFFHADPHPGNLVATDEGSLAYFDFGMMGNIPRHYRVGLIQVLVHFVNRDSLGLANDFLSLGFLPEGVDILSVSEALQASFGDGSRQSRDFQIAAISEASDSAEQHPDSVQDSSTPLRWKAFNMQSVVSATEDLLLFILSEKGLRVRMYLTRDVVKALDAFLQDDVITRNSNGDFSERKISTSEEHTTRVANGFQYFWQAVKKSPEAWISMLARMSVKPEFHNFILDLVSVLMQHSSRKVPETIWIHLSKQLHNLVDSSKS